MKKIIFYITILALISGVNACKDERTTYEITDSAEASFPSTIVNFQMVPEDGNEIVVEMWRGNTRGAVSVPVTIDDSTEGVFTPEKEQFDFADGESIAYLTFTYPDLGDFGGEAYEIELTISDEDQISPSGRSTIAIVAQRRLTYGSIGTGTFTSEFMSIVLEESSFWSQEVLKAEEADFYRLPDCYEDGYTIEFSIQDGEISFAKQPMGYNDPDYGMTSWDPRYLDECEIDGKTLTFAVEFVDDEGSWGKYHEVLELP